MKIMLLLRDLTFQLGIVNRKLKAALAEKSRAEDVDVRKVACRRREGDRYMDTMDPDVHRSTRYRATFWKKCGEGAFREIVGRGARVDEKDHVESRPRAALSNHWNKHPEIVAINNA